MLEKLPEGLGQALLNQRAGLDHTLLRKVHALRELSTMELCSPAFEDDAVLPVSCTADGDGVSPPLMWTGAPADAECVALIVEDADSPTPQPLVHAIALMEPTSGHLPAGDLSSARESAGRLSIGLNSYLQHAWLPPDPPPGHGPHRYVFQVFALEDRMNLSDAPGRGELERAILDHASAAGHLIGVYERPPRASLGSAGDDVATCKLSTVPA
jgi:Raf kinase inhibitor-like YbhB/YbcL family protein